MFFRMLHKTKQEPRKGQTGWGEGERTGFKEVKADSMDQNVQFKNYTIALTNFQYYWNRRKQGE